MHSTPEIPARRLPAVRRDGSGARHVDMRAVIALAAPLLLNSSVQAVLNLTDTWFLGRISSAAVAAVGATYWILIGCFLLFGGTALAVQTLAAHAYGAGDNRAVARATWAGLRGTVLLAPAFLGLALAGPALIGAMRLDAEVTRLAIEFWTPRMLGGILAVALWAATGFFNGIGRPRVTLAVMGMVAVLNAVLNELFIFRLGLGIAGAAWATTSAMGIGAIAALALFLSPAVHREYRSRSTWAESRTELGRIFRIGIPMGLLPAIDLLGWAAFQAMQVAAGAVAGAATQIVMMLTSIAYMPAIGFALAGTTLVGQSIGAGDKDWAARTGNAATALAGGYMGLVTLFLAVIGPWLIPLFIHAADPDAAAVIALGRTLLWLAAGYQIMDGLNLGAGFCLRGAGDMRVPTIATILLSWFVFVPAVHIFTFAPGQGWVDFLPALGYGAVGGWAAAMTYIFVLGTFIFLRWRSGAWRAVNLR